MSTIVSSVTVRVRTVAVVERSISCHVEVRRGHFFVSKETLMIASLPLRVTAVSTSARRESRSMGEE